MASQRDAYVISYLDYRRLVGFVALLLPVFVRFGGLAFEGVDQLPSLSSYYYTSMRDVLVGLLVAVGVILGFYRGVSKLDAILANIVGLIVVGIAVLPMDPVYAPIIHQRFPGFNDTVCYVNHGPLKYHDAISAFFFLLISYMVTFRFPLTKESQITPQKEWRNRIYGVCGVAMFACLVDIVVQLKRGESIIVAETFAIALFGVAWLIKGQQVLEDDESRRTIPVAGRNRWCLGKGKPQLVAP
jgi:hypothetical protein